MSLAALAALDRARDLRDRIEADPLSHIRWTPPQLEWLKLDPATHRKLLRAGNQVGKTTVGLAEVIYRALGNHPYYRTRPPPVEIWIICTSWAQAVQIMNKFWQLVPKEQLLPTNWTKKNGFGKDNPAVTFRNGSIVRFKTDNQGADALASGSIDYVHVDEPCRAETWGELDRRVMRRSGAIGITLTPINQPVEWLRDLVKIGAVTEVHARLTEQNLTPAGARGPLCLLDGTPMNAAWIAAERAKVNPIEAPVRLDGEWETRPEGVFFKCFHRERHVRKGIALDPARGRIFSILGFDYAAADRDYGHTAALSQVQQYADDKGRKREIIHVLDEVVMPGTATSSEFARAVLAMLQRNGLRWTDLYAIHGDNPVESRWVQKSNFATMKALAVEMGISSNALSPRVMNAKDHVRSAASMGAGCQYIFERIADGKLILHPRAELMAKAFETWDYDAKHPMKDIIDALRYSLKPFIFTTTVSTATLRVT